MDELEDGELPPSPVPLSTTGDFPCKIELEDEECEEGELSSSPEPVDVSHPLLQADRTLSIAVKSHELKYELDDEEIEEGELSPSPVFPLAPASTLTVASPLQHDGSPGNALGREKMEDQKEDEDVNVKELDEVAEENIPDDDEILILEVTASEDDVPYSLEPITSPEKMPLKRKAEKGTSSTILHKILGADTEAGKLKIYPNQGFTVEEQSDLSHGTANSDLVEKERKLLAKGIVKEFSAISMGNFDFPYDPYAGAAWPIFQPTDGVFTDRTEQLEQADVRNQTTCLSLCNYIAKKDLLCEYQAGTWEKSFVECSTTAYRKKGRFENRIAFARKFNDKEDLKDARQKDMRNQERDRKAMEDFHKKQAGHNDPHHGERLHHQEIHRRMQTIWSYVSASLFDSYSRKNIYHFDNGRTIEGHRKPSNLPSEWFSVEKKFYIPVNDRKDFLCKYVNYYNKETTEEMERILKENPSWNGMPIRQMVSDWQLPVIVASHVMQKECSGQLRLTEGDHLEARKRLNKMKKILPVGGTVKLADVRRIAQLQEWEIKYWTFIWDNLCSIYKTMPPVAVMMNDLRESVDRAFKSLASPSQRETIYLRCEKLKQDFLTERRASKVNITPRGDRRWSTGRGNSRYRPYGRQQRRVINELDYPYR